MARCFDCLSEDVTVKVIDPSGFEQWFCTADWEANQALHSKIMTLLEDAMDQELAGFKPLGILPTATHITAPD
jgi:hypothetical protein